MNNQWYTVLIIWIWWTCFLFYPLWYVPNHENLRVWLAAGLMAAGIVLGCAFKFLSVQRDEERYTFENDTLFWLILSSVVFCLHIPFFNLPVISGLDMIDHASVPALVASKIIHPLSAKLGVFVPYIFTGIFCLLSLMVVLSKQKRIAILLYFQHIIQWCYQQIVLVYTMLFGITFIYVWFIYTSKLPDTFGDLETIFRYQPISKLMLIPAYIIFGIHEWVGRMIQFLFFIGCAFYLYQTTRLFGSKDAARLTAIIFLLLPPIFHYGNTHLIEGGSLFFVAAPFFYWIRYFEKRSSYDLMAGSFWATLGCLYKHTNVIMIPAFAVLWVWDLCKQRTAKPFKQYGLEIIANSIPAITFMIYMKLSSFSSDTPSDMAFINAARLIENLNAIPQGVTYPIFILFLAGSFFTLFSLHRFLPYWVSWVIPHYMVTAMSLAYMNVRQALPYYLGFIITSGLFLDRIVYYPKVRSLLFYGVIPLYLIWACLFMPRVHTPELWGRAMGDRSYINFTNWNDTYIPYHMIIPDLMQRIPPGETVFAPMGNDTSQFYLAKHNWQDRVYIRNLFMDDGQVAVDSIENLEQQCLQNGYNWLILPRGKWLLQYLNPDVPNVIEPLFVNPPAWLQPIHTYRYGTVEVQLWKIMSN